MGRRRCRDDRSGRDTHLFGKAEADLAPAHQLDIHLRQELRVEQRAVMDAVRAVDAEARAERVEIVLGAGMALLRDRQSVDHPRHADMRSPAARELAIEEAEVEGRVMRHQRRVGDELDQLVNQLREQRLGAQEVAAQSMNPRRLLGHVALGD